MNTQEFSPIAYDLLAYLLEHPNAQDTLEGIVKYPHPWIQAYFHGERAARFGAQHGA